MEKTAVFTSFIIPPLNIQPLNLLEIKQYRHLFTFRCLFSQTFLLAKKRWTEELCRSDILMRRPTYIVPHTVPRCRRPALAGAAGFRSVAESKVGHPFFSDKSEPVSTQTNQICSSDKNTSFVYVLRPDGMTLRRTHGTVCFLWKALPFHPALIGVFFSRARGFAAPSSPVSAFSVCFFRVSGRNTAILITK